MTNSLWMSPSGPLDVYKPGFKTVQLETEEPKASVEGHATEWAGLWPSVHVDWPALSVQAVLSWFDRPAVVGAETLRSGSAIADAGSM